MLHFELSVVASPTRLGMEIGGCSVGFRGRLTANALIQAITNARGERAISNTSYRYDKGGTLLEDPPRLALLLLLRDSRHDARQTSRTEFAL